VAEEVQEPKDLVQEDRDAEESVVVAEVKEEEEAEVKNDKDLHL
jgi:hypothetical protein